MCSSGLCTCRDYVSSMCVRQAQACVRSMWVQHAVLPYTLVYMCSFGLCFSRTMCDRRVLGEPRVVSVRNKSNLLCGPVRGRICAVLLRARAGTMCPRRVRAKPRIVCVQREFNLLCCPIHGRICSVPDCALAKATVVCVDVNRTCCATLFVDVCVQSLVVLLVGPCELDMCMRST